MSIHFAAAKSSALASASSPNAKALLTQAREQVSNDNVDFSEQSEHAELILRAALQHFAEHGLGAATVARAQAEKAFFDGDRETYDWWLGITKTLDRRLASGVSGQSEVVRKGAHWPIPQGPIPQGPNPESPKAEAVNDLDASSPAQARAQEPQTALNGGAFDPKVLTRETPEGLLSIPVVHPDRERPKRNIPKAMGHFRNIIKDKEQTDQVIAVFDEMPWCGLNDAAEEFLTSPRGRKIWLDEPYLPEFLDDHALLRRTPKGSFAHAYCDFMEREELSAAGLVEASDFRNDAGNVFDDGVAWYIDRIRDIHDILHVLTGYGRDMLGEQCILSYMYHQRPNSGMLFLAWAGTVMMKAKYKTRAPLIGALREARHNGKSCPRLVEMPIQQMFSMQLDDVRAQFGAAKPSKYFKSLEILAEDGHDPHAFLAASD